MHPYTQLDTLVPTGFILCHRIIETCENETSGEIHSSAGATIGNNRKPVHQTENDHEVPFYCRPTLLKVPQSVRGVAAYCTILFREGSARERRDNRERTTAFAGSRAALHVRNFAVLEIRHE
jgi:hypothetical protein